MDYFNDFFYIKTLCMPYMNSTASYSTELLYVWKQILHHFFYGEGRLVKQRALGVRMKFNGLYFYNKIQVNTLDKLTKAVTLHCCKHKPTVLGSINMQYHFRTELQLCPHTRSVLSLSLKKKNPMKTEFLTYNYFNISSTKKEVPHD